MKNKWIWIIPVIGIVIIVWWIYRPVIGNVISKNIVNWKISTDPWTVKNDGYTYDGQGRLILDDNGTPIKGATI